MPENPVILAARRTAVGRYLGVLSDLDPLELAAGAARAALAGAGLAPEAVEGLYAGNCFAISCDTGSVVGRQLGLRLGVNGFATTVDTACCSSLTALRLAARSIAACEASVLLVVGVESMSRIPHLARGLRKGVRAGAVTLADPIFPIEYAGYAPVAQDAELGARRYGITREEMDAWAARSHRLWAEAQESGAFADEMVPVQVRSGRETVTVDRDEQPRPGTTAEALAALKPIFGTATITAGNAPGLNDGAAAAVLASPAFARRAGVAPLAEILAAAPATASPDGITWVPGLAIRAALEEAGLGLADLDLVEINEAFAAMPLVSTKELAGADTEEWERLKSITNTQGGAVAVGHPVGASALRIVTTLVHALGRRGGGIGAAAICGGLAQGEAVLVRRPG